MGIANPPGIMADCLVAVQAMSAQEARNPPVARARSIRQAVKRAAIATLFTVILMIPRLRRLRRNVRAWTVIRICALGVGAWLTGCFILAEHDADILLPGILLLAFAALVRARPETRSVDAVAREFGAWVVLNGGAFMNPPEGKLLSRVSLAVSPERLVILGPGERQLLEIPISSVHQIVAAPASAQAATPADAWELQIHWVSHEAHMARFRYEGFFAEHLARIAERTLRSVWKKELPILKA
jgi:hypothetical protein